MILNFNHKWVITRTEFESMIHGHWDEKRVGNFHFKVNDKFMTWKERNWKFVSDGKSTIRAKRWIELARALELV